jgi:hypothetical protein
MREDEGPKKMRHIREPKTNIRTRSVPHCNDLRHGVNGGQ